MSEAAEKVKRIVEFKKKLEKRTKELESELEETRTMLETVNILLLEKGFKRAEMSEIPSTTEVAQRKEDSVVKTPLSPEEHENIIPLKTVAGELLANIYSNEDLLRVVLTENKNFSIDTPPFTQFLVERVLTKMQEKDNELVKTGQLSPDNAFSYNILQDGDMVHEILIRNVDADRLRELKSSIRWTLEKMYEKMKNQNEY